MGTGSLSLYPPALWVLPTPPVYNTVLFLRLFFLVCLHRGCLLLFFPRVIESPVFVSHLLFLQLQRWHSCRLVWHSDFLWLCFSQVRQKEKECPIGTPHRYETERVQSKPWILVPPVSARCHRLIRVSFPPQCKEPRASAGRGRGILRGRSPNGSPVRKTDNFLIHVIAAFGRRADNG